MKSDAIIDRDAEIFIQHVGDHNIDADVRWLIDIGRFPVGTNILDVGCGTGQLVRALSEDEMYARSVVGVEQSPQLAKHAQFLNQKTSATIVEADFLNWGSSSGWRPDIAVMSYFLHHCANLKEFIEHAYSLLPQGGTLYIIDRIALHDDAIPSFERYWSNYYKAAHEWNEERPRIRTIQQISDVASSCGFSLVNFKINPFDKKIGADLFPKSMMEFSKGGGDIFPSVLISPLHHDSVDEIHQRLISETSLNRFETVEVPYTRDVVYHLYKKCPWVELLSEFIEEQPALKPSTLLIPEPSNPQHAAQLFRELSVFKTNHRDDWPVFNVTGDTRAVRPMVLPFHIPEPHESHLMRELLEKTESGVL